MISCDFIFNILNSHIFHGYSMCFSPTLYIGEHVHGLYATRSLVDQNVVTITASDAGPLLLGGPHAPESPKVYQEHLSGHNYWLPAGTPISPFSSIIKSVSNFDRFL